MGQDASIVPTQTVSTSMAAEVSANSAAGNTSALVASTVRQVTTSTDAAGPGLIILGNKTPSGNPNPICP